MASADLSTAHHLVILSRWSGRLGRSWPVVQSQTPLAQRQEHLLHVREGRVAAGFPEPVHLRHSIELLGSTCRGYIALLMVQLAQHSITSYVTEPCRDWAFVASFCFVGAVVVHIELSQHPSDIVRGCGCNPQALLPALMLCQESNAARLVRPL